MFRRDGRSIYDSCKKKVGRENVKRRKGSNIGIRKQQIDDRGGIKRVSGRGYTYDQESVQVVLGHMGGNRPFL